MYKLFIAIYSIVVFLSCKNKTNENASGISQKSNRDTTRVSNNVVLLPNGDTDFVLIRASAICFKINYYKNKPQYINIYDSYVSDNKSLNYKLSNAGVFLTFDSSIASIKHLGFKYLKGASGADLLINDTGNVKGLSIWNDYSNEGDEYEFKDTKNGKIGAYLLKDGEKSDSIIYVRQGKRW